jgi:AraC family transcriptional regulator of adaptative response/methylated-DNA-[protein]-cysteine methyltransferase
MTIQDGERIRQAILYLERHYRRQPSLEQLAAAVGLSPFHFQRLFKRWAGVSPKRFLQFLTVEHAKAALRDGRSALDTAYDSGLSGPGRLHDLFVAVEAVTPGEYKQSGEGLVIRHGFHSTPFGECLLALTERGICGLAFADRSQRDDVLETLVRRWPAAALERDQAGTADTAARVFERDRAGPPLTLSLRGTNFQIKVWEALLRIPPGALVSYGDIARSIGHPAAYRAVGSAVGQNAIAYLIPCHRVIRESGAFGNYRWGTARKQAMVGWEAAQREGGGDPAAPALRSAAALAQAT